MSALPRGWVESSIEDVGVISSGFGFPDRFQGNVTGELPFAKVRDISQAHQRNGGLLSSAANYISRDDLVALKARTVPAGSVAFAKIGEALKLNRRVLLDVEAVLDNNCMAVTPHKGLVEPNFLYRFLTTLDFAPFSVATTVPSIRKGDVGRIRLPLPPLAEQKRIVTKLDALNAKSARARTELARIETLVSRYKQAVLSKAFSGELTLDWRLEATQNDIEAVLEAVRAKRQCSSKLARRKPASDVPQVVLPDNWHWISPDELAADAPYSIGIGPFGSNLVKSDYKAQGVRLVFVRDIRREEFSEDSAVYVDNAKADELHQHWVSGGDVLITKMGDPPGDTAIYPPEQPPAVITADCIKMRPHLDLTSSRFLYWAIRSQTVKSQILEETKGVAQQKLSLDRFRQIAIPTPPIPEQHEIVRRIESAFAKIGRLAAEAKRALALVGKLDEAILAKAFRGELVPQDENDEPAEKLLERIRAERMGAPMRRRR